MDPMLAPWLSENLACPRHRVPLAAIGQTLHGSCGCRFPVVDDIPVMLLDDVAQTIGLAHASMRLSRQPDAADPLYVESLGISEAEKAGVRRLAGEGGGIDPVVSYLVGATNGIAYKGLIGGLSAYPIPDLPMEGGGGEVLLDVGCGWGRWSSAAARKGYRAVGVDPSLGAVTAARRAARALGVDALFVVGDARYLPFKDASIDRVFSYSVLQHMSRPDVARAAGEIGRVLASGGTMLVQMPTTFGVRCLYHQVRRGFREGEGFDVRYWSLPALRRVFETGVGPTSFSIDGFFGIGLQWSDRGLMPLLPRMLLSVSRALTRLGRRATFLTWVADSVYVSSARSRGPALAA